MPFLDLRASRNLRMFYQQNPSITGSGVESLQLHTSEPPPSHPIDPSKPTVVFFHSTFASESIFIGQMSDARMRAAWNMVAFDERWHGRTEETDTSEYVGCAEFDALKIHQEDAVAALDMLGLQKYCVVGEGHTGSRIAIELAVQYPDQVQAVVLSTPGNIEDPKVVQDAVLNEFVPLALANKDGKGDASGKITADALGEIQNSNLGYARIRLPDRERAFVDYVATRYGAGFSSHDMYHLLRVMMRSRPTKDYLSRIRAPIMILSGDGDTYFPTNSATEWRDTLLDAGVDVDLRTIRVAPM